MDPMLCDGHPCDTDEIAEGSRIIGFVGSGIDYDDAKIIFFETDSILVKVEKVKLIPCKQIYQCCLKGNAIAT